MANLLPQQRRPANSSYLHTNISTQKLRPQSLPPIDIVFRNLSYAVMTQDKKSRLCNRSPKIRKDILKGITGMFRHGRVMAIMGASGAGKTSLLDIIACRINQSRHVSIAGDIFVNMRPYDYKTFGNFGNYVMQHDILMQTLTVRETLQFAASMTLNKSEQQRNSIIEALLLDLKLERCADVLVGGNDIKGISGGERKRTSLASELVSDPQVILIDEPTSGLDSLTAYVIIWYLRKLAEQRNKTIAITIHQPSSEIFALFQDYMLMVSGRLIYQGPAAQTVDYFHQMGWTLPQFSNPSDYLMSIVHQDSKRNVANYPRHFQAYQQNLAPRILSAISSSERGFWQSRVIKTGFCRGLVALMKRDLINIRRNPALMIARVFQTVILSLFLGGLFWRLSADYEDVALSAFSSKNGCLFCLAVNVFMMSFAPVVAVFPTQKPVFLKQQASKMYSVFAYFLSRNIIELILIATGPTLTVLIVYWMMGLHSGAGYFFLYLLISFLSSLAGNSYGLMYSSFFNNARLAGALSPLVTIPIISYSGFYKNKQDLPNWIGWIQYLSPIKYTFIAYANNEYRNTVAPTELLNFSLSLTTSLILIVVLSIGARIIAYIVLSTSKAKLQS